MGDDSKRIAGQCEFMRRCYASHNADQRTGYRSALFDAVHMCDAFAADILKAGKPSRRRDAEAALLKSVADRMWALHEELHGQSRTPSPTESEVGTAEG